MNTNNMFACGRTLDSRDDYDDQSQQDDDYDDEDNNQKKRCQIMNEKTGTFKCVGDISKAR